MFALLRSGCWVQNGRIVRLQAGALSTKGRSGEKGNNNNNNNQSTAAFTPVRDTSGGEKDERWEEGKYTFSDVLWEHRYLFLSIPFLMMLVRGAQEYTWPETPATVVQHQPEAGSITYRYYCDGRVVEHVQVRSPPARAFERVMYRGGHSRPEGSDPEDQERLQPGDIIRIHINPRRPNCSVYHPLPLALWHIGLLQKKHPQLGNVIEEPSASQ